MARPFLKWAGGKARLVPLLAEAIAEQPRRYIEPFLGGGAVYFGLQAVGLSSAAVLNDLNHDLIETFGIVRDDPGGLITRLGELEEEYMAGGAEHRAACYYRRRGAAVGTPIDLAARFIFLNRTCFNGLYRVNRSGQFNVPHGRYERPRICDPAGLAAAAAALRGVELRSEDFEAICEEAGPGDLLYLDPPYQPLSRTSSFTSYTGAVFGQVEQRRLAAAARRAWDRGAAVIVSNSAHPLVESLYEGFHIRRVLMSRAINSVPGGRLPIDELLISNEALCDAASRRAPRPLRPADRPLPE